MEKWVCTVCGYVYDPAENDGVRFEDLPDDYVCPLCSVGKDQFENFDYRLNLYNEAYYYIK